MLHKLSMLKVEVAAHPSSSEESSEYTERSSRWSKAPQVKGESEESVKSEPCSHEPGIDGWESVSSAHSSSIKKSPPMDNSAKVEGGSSYDDEKTESAGDCEDAHSRSPSFFVRKDGGLVEKKARLESRSNSRSPLQRIDVTDNA